MGAGEYADAQYLFTENVCGYGKNRAPRYGKTYRNFQPELEHPQNERIAAFKAFKSDVDGGQYPMQAHTVGIDDNEFDAFLKSVKS